MHVKNKQLAEIISLRTLNNCVISHTYLKVDGAEKREVNDFIGLRMIIMSTQDKKDKTNFESRIEDLLHFIKLFVVFRLGISFLEKTLK